MTRERKIPQLAPAIAEHLGDEWGYTPETSRQSYVSHYLTHQDGPRLVLGEKVSEQRLTVRGVFPQHPTYGTFPPHDGNRHVIGLSTTKDARRITLEIRRRLLRHYMLEYPEAVGRMQAEVCRQRAIYDMATRLAEIVGKGREITGTPVGRAPYGFWMPNGICYGNVRVDSLETISLTRFSLSLAQAEAVLRALMDMEK